MRSRDYKKAVETLVSQRVEQARDNIQELGVELAIINARLEDAHKALALAKSLEISVKAVWDKKDEGK